MSEKLIGYDANGLPILEEAESKERELSREEILGEAEKEGTGGIWEIVARSGLPVLVDEGDDD